MGIFSSFFKQNKALKQQVKTLDLYVPTFGKKHGPKANDTFMSAILAHARHGSKFQPVVYMGDEPAQTPDKRQITNLLSLRPNKIMNAPTFWEKVTEQYYEVNNVFIYVDWNYLNDKQPLRSLWIITPDDNSMEVRRSEKGETFMRFIVDGQEIITNIDNIIHIARNVDTNEIWGEGNAAIDTVLEVIQTNYEGLEQAIKTSAFLRFIVQSTTPLTEAVKAEKAKKFADQYLGAGATGVAYIDAAQQIIQVNSQGKYCDAEQSKALEAKIYNYLGINEKIINATYNEDEWQSYYESALEPLALKLESELTYKLFTQKELSLGLKVKIDANRLQAASLKTRATVAAIYQKLPVYKPNTVCELLYLPHLENGEKEYSTLNYVDADKQDEYQGVKGQKDPEPKDNSAAEEKPEGDKKEDDNNGKSSK